MKPKWSKCDFGWSLAFGEFEWVLEQQRDGQWELFHNGWWCGIPKTHAKSLATAKKYVERQAARHLLRMAREARRNADKLEKAARLLKGGQHGRD